jgi:hypothetical protein
MPKETPEDKEIRLAEESEQNKLSEEAKLAEQAEQARLLKEQEDADTATILKAEAELAETERNKAETVSIKGVVLKGTASQKVGTHSVHLTSAQIVNFIDGKAEVKEDVELALKNAGFIE